MHRYSVFIVNVLLTLNKRQNVFYSLVCYVVALCIYPFGGEVANLVCNLVGVYTFDYNGIRCVADALKYHDFAGLTFKCCIYRLGTYALSLLNIGF